MTHHTPEDTMLDGWGGAGRGWGTWGRGLRSWTYMAQGSKVSSSAVGMRIEATYPVRVFP